MAALIPNARIPAARCTPTPERPERAPSRRLALRRSEGGVRLGRAAVIFDLFGTLAVTVGMDESRSTVDDMAGLLGCPPDRFARQWADTSLARIDGRFPTVQANLVAICRELGVEADRDRVERAARRHRSATERALRPRQDALATLAELRLRTVRVGVLTDCSPAVPPVWSASVWADAADAVVFSCRIGHHKPCAYVYRALCLQLGVSPQQCLYVGDGGSDELAGARGVGMMPLLLRDPDDRTPAYRPRAADWSGRTIPNLPAVIPLTV